MATRKLIGTDPDQVSVNGDLGTLAFQDSESVRVTNLRVDGDLTVVGAQALSGNITLGDASGDTVTINAGTTTLTQGTANGVLYLNGSKVITSGTALTFDGTNLYGGTGAANTLSLKSTSGNANRAGISIGNILNSDNGGISFSVPGASVETVAVRISGTTGNVGIGTTAPTSKLHVQSATSGDGGSFNGTGSVLYVKQDTTWSGNQPWALYVSGYSYLNGFRINADDGIRALYKTNAGGQLGFATAGDDPITFTQNAGSERVRIAAGGNVGIGTTTPGYKLHVASTGDTTARIDSTNGQSPELSLFSNGIYDWRIQGGTALRFVMDSAERLRIDAAGNIGIGTTTPGSKLDVFGNTMAFRNSALGSAGSLDIGLAVASPVSARISFGTDNSGWQMRFAKNVSGTYTDYVTITDGGNVGIGTITPGVKLDINGSARIANASSLLWFNYNSTANGPSITGGSDSLTVESGPVGPGRGALTLTGHNNTTLQTDSGFLILSASESGSAEAHIRFSTAGTERMRILSTGNVGIGTSSPLGRLDVKGKGNSYLDGLNIVDSSNAAKTSFVHTAGSLFVGIANNASGADASADFEQRIRIYEPTTTATDPILQLGDPDFTILQNGNVGIGTTTPASKLQIGSVGATGYAVNSGLAFGDGTRAGALNTDPSGVTLYSSIDLIFAPGTSEKMRINSAGNLGLGVTPSAWNNVYKVVQIGSGTVLSQPAAPAVMDIYANAYIDSAFANRYIGTAHASHYEQNGGQHRWYNAPSGTAGNVITFTQAMTLNASGNLGIGTTAPNAPLEVVSTAASIVARSTAAAQSSLIFAAASDYYSLPSFQATGLVQYNASATGTTLGLANASLGVLNFQNTSGAAILTNGINTLRIGTFSTTAISISGTQVTSIGGVAGAESLRVTPVTSAVNYLNVFGGATGNAVGYVANGSDANISIGVTTKGSGASDFYSNNYGSLQFRIAHTASAVNYLQVTGGATTAYPYFSAQGSDANIGINFSSKGTGTQLFNVGAYAVLRLDGGAVSNQNTLQMYSGSGSFNFVTLGADVNVTNNYYAKGTGSHSFFTNTALQFNIAHTASAVNYVQVTGAATGGAIVISANGSDTNVGMSYISKGAGQQFFYSSGSPQFNIGNTASAVNYLRVNGGATGSGATLSAQGTDTNINLILTPKGTGNVGIGTTTPAKRLDVFDDNASTTTITGLLVTNYNTTNDSRAGIVFRNYDNYGASIWSRRTGTTAGNLSFGTNAATGTAETNIVERMRIDSVGNVGIGTSAPAYKLEVNGSFAATTKSFVIDHPTKPNMKLRYGSLEGPENGVYVRGKLMGNTIELPEYWTKLVDPDSITVTLTPIGRHQKLYVEDIINNTVIVGNESDSEVKCFYVVYGERCDVDKLEVEID